MRTWWWKAFRIAVASPLVALVAVPDGRGEDFRVSADVMLQEEYEDNVAFSSTAQESSWVTTLAPGVRARYGSEHASATAAARWEARAYSTDGDLNTVNQLYDVGLERRRERVTMGASAGLIFDTTLDSELQQTGIVLDRDQRLSGRVGADLGFAVSELTQTTWRYRYTNTKYDAPTLVDYFDHWIRWETVRVLSEGGQSVGVLLNGMFVDADRTYRSQEWSASASYTHPLSEQDRADLTAGIRWTRAETGLPLEAVSTDIGLVGEASLTRRWESVTVSLALSKRTNPSGSGRLIDTTRLALHGAYALTDHATATLRADWYRNTDVVSFGASQDSTFVSVESGISWQMTERVTAAAAYTHEHQRYPAGRVDANRVLVRLVYKWYREE